MHTTPQVQPLPYRQRKRTFGLLLTLFLVSLPFLYLYATGYRFDLNARTNLVSTGGMYVAAERTGAEIFIDGELVRETRAFRRAFYAQNLDPGTHRVHVQKEGQHTWVKELPVTSHLVTEAQAFNLPLVPQVRLITQWQTATGSAVVKVPITYASSTNEFVATTTLSTTKFTPNAEYDALTRFFGTTTPTTTPGAVATVAKRIGTLLEPQHGTTTATTTEAQEVPTTTKESNGVRLYEQGDDVYAEWVGSFSEMPYYYCAETFPPYSSSTPVATTSATLPAAAVVAKAPIAEAVEDEVLIQPVQTVAPDTVCEPKIRIDRKGQAVKHFDFVPGSTDYVIMGLQDGVYMVEIDDRSWQNVQPIMAGNNLDFRVENGVVYVFDGTIIYQMTLKY